MSYFPFFSFPYNNYYNRAYPYYKNNKVIHDVPKDSTINSSDKTYNEKKSSKYNSFANINISALLESDINTPILEILGIKLYLDDLIIIGLLFFLYKEGVEDEILFGILLLLLLS